MCHKTAMTRRPPDHHSGSGIGKMACRLAWIAAVVVLVPMSAGAQLPEYVLESTVRIGSVDDPQSALDLVSVLAVAPDGRLAVAQPMETSVWVFSPTGERLEVVGRAGDGPGEFRAISAMGWQGDTLWVADGSLFRVTFLDPESGPLGTVGGQHRQVDGVIRAPLPAGDGRWILYRRWPLDPQRSTYREEIWSADEQWQPLERLGHLPEGPDGVQLQFPERERPIHRPHPLPQHPLYAVAPDAASLTVVRREVEREGYAVTRMTVEGDTVFHREHAVMPRPVTRDDRAAILEDYLSDESLQRAASSTGALRRAVESALQLPGVYPAVTKVVVGRDGATWLRGPDDRSGTVSWTVLDPTGEPSFTVRTDREIGMFQGRVEIYNLVRMAADADGLWAVVPGEFDVPYVVRYELRPPDGGQRNTR